VNLDAVIVARSVFYPESRQVHWWVATTGNYPDLELVLQTNETRETDDGVRKGWALHTGKKARAYCACVYAENVDTGLARSLVLRPFIGVTTADGFLLRCDTGTTDNGTAYIARVVPRPIIRGLRQFFGVHGATLLATISDTAYVMANMYRNFGERPEREKIGFLSSPTADETQVFVDFDNLSITGCRALEIEFMDNTTPGGQWRLNRFDLTASDEETLPG
jgi:hypothetical protein